MLFLIFFPTSPEVDLSASSASLTASITHSPPPKRRDALIVGLSTLLTLLLFGIVSIALVSRYPHRTQRWADFLGIVAGVLSAIQYLPQIWYTYRLGDIKSLSIITMLIQVPGAFLFAFSLWLRVSWEGWSTWLVYIITGILQGMLLGMAVSFWVARRRKGEGVEEDGSYGGVDDVDGANDEDEADERTPLTSNKNGSGRKPKPINGTQRSASDRQFGMLYAATPPEHDSDRSSGKDSHK